MSIAIVAVFLVAACVLGVRAGRGQDKVDLAAWSVGGRSLGLLMTLVLMAGETYTTFSYLGAAGWSYTHGVSALYVVAYLSIGMAASYVVGPLLWSYAHRHGLHNVTDIAAHRFGAPWLGVLLTVAATVFLLPYVQLQITGMGTVVASVSYGAIGLGVSYLVAFVVSEVFVLASGLRGSAWVSVLKDVTVVVTLAVVFVFVPLHFFGGYGAMFAQIGAERAAWLTMPGPGSSTYGLAWFLSTALLNGAVYSVIPTTVAGFLGAASPQILRRNALLLPLYQVLLFVPVILGLAATFVVPGLKDSNLALFEMLRTAMPEWLFGLVGAAGALSAIVPLAVFMLAIGTMWSRSVLGLHARTRGRQRQLAQLVTLLAGGLALGMTYLFPNALVRLSVISYEGLAQLLPLVVIALVWRRMSLAGGVAGLVAGLLVVLVLMATGNDPWGGINAGAIGLVLNLLVTAAVSLARPGAAPADRLAAPELVPARSGPEEDR
ncbi:sodium:solute symporter family protein [Pseudonocardia kujensis]|uniref:sodium:solute symporter family protein n=1 Tax=Pseudonocardia kujensis TaxID=1128675 RepID=UPI001E5BA247|nr:sodium:solute symporter family protein [Pseudonocardia kujensis]MCE0762725.1 sodium:solute symporter family protein [Pseudonocardia kujensis]